MACKKGHFYAVDMLITRGANIELGVINPLMMAAKGGYLYIVTYILQCGANVNAETPLAETALFFASENGHADTVNLLLEHGANVVSIPKFFNTLFNNHKMNIVTC